MQAQLQKIRQRVESELNCSAHNLDHVDRVFHLAMTIASDLPLDLDILKPSVLLHDIARVHEDNDNSGKTDHALLGADMARDILLELDYSESQVKHIQECILSHRYRNGIKPSSLEAKVLFDSDKLDAIGAVGVARGFVWVGRNSARIYSDEDIETYTRRNLGGKINGRIQDKTQHSPQIEFETKLKWIKDHLYTAKAREIGIERTRIYRDFLIRLEREVHGEC